jgi:hypothetical protein
MIMGKFSKYVSGLLQVKILKIDPILRMWIFGLLILIMSIFSNIKLIPFILVFMIVLTISYRKSMESNFNRDIEYLFGELDVLEEHLEIAKEHLETKEATLEERILINELEKEKEEIELVLQEITEKLEVIKRQNNNFKNFLVKLKKPSKMFVTGKKEK